MNLLKLKYIIVPVISYWATKVFFPTPEDQRNREERKKPKNIPPGIIKDPDPLEINSFPDRGGFSQPSSFLKKLRKLISENRYLLSGILSLCSVAVFDRYSTVLTEILKGSSPAITALPVPLVKKLLLGFETSNPRELLLVLKKGLTSSELSIDEKLKLVKKTLQALLVTVNTGPARRYFLLSVLLAVLGVAFQSGGLLGGGVLCFQEIFTRVGFKRATVQYIIDIYQDYNTPFPKELIDVMKEIGLE